MNNKIRKHLTKVVIAVLLISTLSAFVPMVQGAGYTHQNLTQNEKYGWLTGIDINGAGAGSVPDDDVFVGQKDITLTPTYEFNRTSSVDKDGLNISYQTTQPTTEEIKILEEGADWDSWNPDDWNSVSTSPFVWEDFEDSSNYYFGDTDQGSDDTEHQIGTFKFNITNEATPGIYRIPMRIRCDIYNTSSGTWSGQENDFEYFYLELSGNAEVAVGGVTLDPGDEFEQKKLNVHNQGDDDLKNINLSLDLDTSQPDGGDNLDDQGVVIHNPDDTSYNASINQGATGDIYFTFSVPMNTEPGDYVVDYTLVATRENDDITVTEHGEIIITIRKLAEITATIRENNVTKGTTTKNFTVDFKNTGNLDLERVKIRAVTDGFYFFTPKDYYHYGSAEAEEGFVELGMLNVSETKSAPFIMGMEKELQVGKHLIDFEYFAYFYDEMGEESGAERYVNVTDKGYDAEMGEPSDFISVEENPTYTSVIVRSIEPVRITDMGFRIVNVTVQNKGFVNYTDVELTLHTDGTPFINPDNPAENTVEMMDQPFSLYGDTTYTASFGVKIDTTFIEDRLDEDDPIYDVECTMTALNKDMTENVTKTISGQGEVRGVGPVIMVRGDLKNNDVKAGEKFTLNYTLENIGDEPVRELSVRISPQNMWSGTEFDEGQEAVFYQQATGSPGAYVWKKEPVDRVLNPGETTNVEFKMVASSDMQPGAIYHLSLEVNGKSATSDYERWGTSSTIRSEEDKSTKPFFSEELTLILVAIIIGVFFALGMFLLSKKKEEEEAPPAAPAEGAAAEETFTETPEESYEEEEEVIEPEPEWEEEGEVEEEEIFAEEEAEEGEEEEVW